VQRAAERVTASVAGNAGTGRGGTGRSPKTVGQGLRDDQSIGQSSPDVAEQRRAAEGGTQRYGPTPPHSLREHDGPEPDGPGAQQIPTGVHRQSQATDRNAREGAPRANGKPPQP
jgi:hypothetical protein